MPFNDNSAWICLNRAWSMRRIAQPTTIAANSSLFYVRMDRQKPIFHKINGNWLPPYVRVSLRLHFHKCNHRSWSQIAAQTPMYNNIAYSTWKWIELTICLHGNIRFFIIFDLFYTLTHQYRTRSTISAKRCDWFVEAIIREHEFSVRMNKEKKNMPARDSNRWIVQWKRT